MQHPPEHSRRHDDQTSERPSPYASALRNAIFHSAIFSKIGTDVSGVIQVFNDGAERMLGYTSAEVVDKMSLASLCDPQERAAHANALATEMDSPVGSGFHALVFKASRGIEDIHELTYLRKDGARVPAIVSVSALSGVDGGRIGYLLTSTDNTARKQVDAEQRRLEVALRQTNAALEAAKFAAEKANLAKSDFLSGMSHELRSPLNAILGFAQLMESGFPLPTPSQKESIDQILHAGWYLLELINEILDLSLIESGKLSLSSEPMSLTEVLEDCHSMIEPQATSSDIRLTFAPAEHELFVHADRTRVKQVLVNLLSNAIKYNRIGGAVEVVCEALATGRIRVSFRDTGLGLSAEDIAQLFQPFNRLGQEAGPKEGTGIGLVVSKRLVELMGGSIGVESEVGVGSVFWIELNAAVPHQLEPELPEDVRHRPRLATEPVTRHLLYVEDNTANMRLVERLVERRSDMRLLSANTGLRGVEIARQSRPDVILMDINLPGLNGFDAMRILSADARTSAIPVIAISANAMPHDVSRGLQAGFFRYLTKPIKVQEFMDTLDAALKFLGEREDLSSNETVNETDP